MNEDEWADWRREMAATHARTNAVLAETRATLDRMKKRQEVRMATNPERDERRPVLARIDTRARYGALLAAAGAIIALTPTPLDALGAALLVLVAYQSRR